MFLIRAFVAITPLLKRGAESGKQAKLCQAKKWRKESEFGKKKSSNRGRFSLFPAFAPVDHRPTLAVSDVNRAYFKGEPESQT